MYTIEALLESVMKSIILAPLFTLTQTACIRITASSFSSYSVAPYPGCQSSFFSFLISDFKPQARFISSPLVLREQTSGTRVVTTWTIGPTLVRSSLSQIVIRAAATRVLSRSKREPWELGWINGWRHIWNRRGRLETRLGQNMKM